MPSSMRPSRWWPGACWGWGSRLASGSGSGRRTTPSGSSCSTPPPRSGPSWSTSTRPTGPPSWPMPWASPGCRPWSWPRASARPTTWTCSDRWPPSSPPWAGGWCSAPTPRPGRWAGRSWSRGPGGCRPERLARARGPAPVRRPHQHPVHLGHHRVPQGRHPVAPQHPQQRLVHRRGLRLHRGRPGLYPGAAVPLLRHGPGQSGLHHPRGRDGLPGRGLRAPRPPWPRSRPSAAPRCMGCRRCSSPSWNTPASATSTCPACAPGSWPARPARSR